MTDMKRTSSNEEEYFARREAELLRQQRDAAHKAAIEAERKAHYMKCPKCGHDLKVDEFSGLEIDRCTFCEGVFFAAGELEEVFSKRFEERKGIWRRVLGI